MPKATVSSEARIFPLETAPPDGFIKVKQLSHGQKLHRIDIGAKLSFQNDGAQRGRNRKQQNNPVSKTDVDLLQLHARQYEYTHMIVEHNLEEDDGSPFNFSDITSFDRLAPQIGEEIDDILDQVNEGKIDKELFQQPSKPVSTVEAT